ncbi:MAG: hypothetical protein EXR57_05655 [Dehalococcoidia bacterium]|nr:hypothetical protein [Dehalococcoidia bacterium]MSQ35284.1 hypothetical protein [Dehalococcoidia bacterium]
MSKRMTVVFDDEALYTAVKVEAARTGRHATDIVAQALYKWLEAQKDADLSEGLDEIRGELKRVGGVEAAEFFAGSTRGRRPAKSK